MAENGLGAALLALRERRSLSVRELATLADVDHAYIYRLESGEKSNPSKEALEKLVKGLKAAERDAKLLRWLAEHDADQGLVRFAIADSSVTLEEFSAAAMMAHRAAAKPDASKIIERVRRILAEED